MDLVFLFITVVIVAFLVGVGAWIGYRLGLNKLPKAAREQGVKNAGFSILIVLAAGGIIALISIWGGGQSTKNGFAIAFITIVVGSFFYFFFYWLTNRRRAGKVLLDIMPYPTKTLTLVSAGFFVLMGFLGSFRYFWRDFKYAWAASILIGLCMAITQVITALSRLQVCENGILAYVDLIRWAKIESVDWVDTNEVVSTLKLRYKGRLPGALRKGAMPVPAEKKAALDSILKKYLAQPRVSDDEN